MKRILLVTDNRFWKIKNGASSRINSLCTTLCNSGYEVGLFFVGVLSDDERLHLKNIGIAHACNVIDGRLLIHSSFSIYTLQLFLHLPRYLLKLWYHFRRKSFPYKKFYHLKTLRCFETFIDFFHPEVVLVEYLHFSFLSSVNNCSNSLWILDSHDVMYLRFLTYLHRGLLHWISITKEQEIEAISKFDAVIAIQHEEADIFRSIVNVPVLTVAHAVKVNPVSQCSINRSAVGFVASDSQANCDGIRWFIDNVLPLVLYELPDICLYIAGGVCQKLINLPNDHIKIWGYIDSLADFYSSVDIIINPVFSGGGLKIKNVEALAFGVPLITTTLGAQGLIFDESPPFAIANSSHEFFKETLSFLSNIEVRADFLNRGLVFIDKYFSPESVYKPLLDFIDEKA